MICWFYFFIDFDSKHSWYLAFNFNFHIHFIAIHICICVWFIRLFHFTRIISLWNRFFMIKARFLMWKTATKWWKMLRNLLRITCQFYSLKVNGIQNFRLFKHFHQFFCLVFDSPPSFCSRTHFGTMKEYFFNCCVAEWFHFGTHSE